MKPLCHVCRVVWRSCTSLPSPSSSQSLCTGAVGSKGMQVSPYMYLQPLDHCTLQQCVDSCNAASCCSNCMLLQSIRCAYTLNSARLKTVLAQCHSDVSSIVTRAMSRLVFHPVCLTAGKFFWFLLYTYLTQIYFTFFGESLKLCLVAHKMHM